MQANKENDGRLQFQSTNDSRSKDRQDVGKISPDTVEQMLEYSGYKMVYAFDPGDTTGTCFMGGGEALLSHMNQEQLFKILALDGKDASAIPSIVIYETFVTRPVRFVRTQIASENIGAIKYWAHLNGFKLLSVQPSQTHKIPRADVKAAGWKWNTEHEFDAIRILIYGMTLQHYRGEK